MRIQMVVELFLNIPILISNWYGTFYCELQDLLYFLLIVLTFLLKNDAQEYIRVIEGTDVSDNCINEGSSSATPVEVVSSRLIHAGVLSEQIDLLVNNQPSENPEAKDANAVSGRIPCKFQYW